MKKIALLAILFIAVVGVSFGQFQIGPTALYNLPFVGSDDYYEDENGTYVERPEPKQYRISLRDFTFGAEARLTLFNFIQGSAIALYRPGFYDEFEMKQHQPMLETFLDVGIVLDLAILRFGFGVGPNFNINLNPPPGQKAKAFKAGFNGKITGDLVLGDLTLSGNFITRVEDLSELEYALENLDGQFGVSVLLKMF